MRENLRKSGKFPHVLVPFVYEALSTRRLLVMEEIYPCTPLHQALDAQAELIAKQVRFIFDLCVDVCVCMYIYVCVDRYMLLLVMEGVYPCTPLHQAPVAHPAKRVSIYI